MERDPHRIAEERSLALHQRIAERIRAHPEILVGVREGLQAALRAGGRATPYLAVWLALIDGPLENLLARLVADDEDARAMRQCTPFAGVISPRETSAIRREVNALTGSPR